MEQLMIKTILVPISGSDTDVRVFSAALSVARPLAAHLKFFHVRLSACEAAIRTRHVEYSMGPAINSALHALEQDQAERSETAIEQTEAFCAIEGISFRDSPGVTASVTAEIIEETDHAESRLLTHARHSDLLVLGRPAHEDLMPYYLLETLLLGSGRPILIVPDSRPAQASGTIVVGWQETPAAARALTAALPLMKCAQRVVLVNVGEPHCATAHDLDRVASQLSWHGISAEVRHLMGTAKSASQVLLQSASELNPEVLVVGGYSHRPLQEMIFGGVTRALLAQAETPIFVMH
jgi:nucleotide-binding universal stress UspA family protein